MEYSKFAYYITDKREFSGYIAQKIADITKKQAIVLYTYEEDDSYHGSIRSRGIQNFKQIINDTALAQASGHNEAAGIILPKENLLSFFDKLDLALKNTQQSISYDADGEISLSLVDVEFAQAIETFNKITGKDFPKATFIIRNLTPGEITIMKDKHSKFIVDDITFLMWNNTEIYHLYNNLDFYAIDVLGTFTLNQFRGKTSINFIIEDYILKTNDLWI